MPGLSISITGLASPPVSATRIAYRPAVTLRNDSDVVVYFTGVLSIKDATTGRAVFSSPLSCPPIPAGASTTAQAAADWTPDLPGQYLVSASAFASHAGASASAALAPVTVSVEVVPIPPIPGAHNLQLRILAKIDDKPEEGVTVVQYPFYLQP